MSNHEWHAEPKPVPPELTEGYRAQPYRDPFSVPVRDKISAATHAQLLAIFGGHPIDPSLND